jgi:hypothetical protein
MDVLNCPEPLHQVQKSGSKFVVAVEIKFVAAVAAVAVVDVAAVVAVAADVRTTAVGVGLAAVVVDVVALAFVVI